VNNHTYLHSQSINELQGFQFHIFASTCYCLFGYLFIVAILMSVKWSAILLLIYIWLMLLWWLVVLAICKSFFEKYLLQFFAHFKIRLIFCCSIVRVLYMCLIVTTYQRYYFPMFFLFYPMLLHTNVSCNTQFF
jgi:hypothetical protein